MPNCYVIILNVVLFCCFIVFIRLCNCGVVFQFEADRRAIIITINSFGTELTKEDREKLYPRRGKLYPDGLSELAKADDYDSVKRIASYYAVSDY